MPSIDLKTILNDSVAVVKPILGKSWKDFKPYAEHEFKKFAESAEFLAKLKLQNSLDDEELKARLELQKLALKNVMLTIQGVALVTAQKAVNAVLDIVAKAIKTVINVSLPI